MSIVLALKVDPGVPIRRGSAYFWRVIRDLTETDRDAAITVPDIHRQTAGADPATIRSFLQTLARAGILEELPTARGQAARWRVVRRPTHLPRLSRDGRVVPSGQDAMWTAIRNHAEFDARDIAHSATTEERPVSLATALAYIQRLHHAGYLKVQRAGTPGQHAVYRLKRAMNTGPAAPMILRTKLVYDPNTHAVVGAAEAEEVAP
ncbi:hypothetical protein [Blastochloris tepida]|uniref:Uncharacterized protein n=1 Tax=Blastochloris tepida TaxID=2233851 RepID=A0A348FYL2_9HYPH|nr:hypothetical protein [Blastochloris tepida]BBF92395.1 hypothetical protein BLTE_10800 [Blastochloris tepida]